MNTFFKSIKWTKFIKYELIALSILLILYFSSSNKYPQNFYTIPIILGIWTFLILFSSYNTYKLKNK